MGIFNLLHLKSTAVDNIKLRGNKTEFEGVKIGIFRKKELFISLKLVLMLNTTTLYKDLKRSTSWVHPRCANTHNCLGPALERW